MDEERYYLQTAVEMLALDSATVIPSDWYNLNCDLKAYLDLASEMCEKAGGRLVSRQAIATLILQWVDKHPDEVPYDHRKV